MHVTVISGSNRPGNLSLEVANCCMGLLEEFGQPSDLIDLQSLPRDIAFDYLGEPAAFAPFQGKLDASTHVCIVAPEYNGSIPGILKLFLDACRYPDTFSGKSIAMVGLAAGGLGNEPGLRHLAEIMQSFGAQLFEGNLHLPRIHKLLHPMPQFRGSLAYQAVEKHLKDWLMPVPVTTND
jgi:NAD(P)H-dependent FMN reductase